MRKIIIAGLCALLLLGLGAPALAYLVSPTSVTFDSNPKVFRHLAEQNDTLIVFPWEWAMASDNWSETPASESIMYRLYDTDNTTVLFTGTPYVFSLTNTNGYGHNVGSFYAPADNLTWGAAYTIEILGLPAYYSPTVSQSKTLTPSDYSTATTQEASRIALYNYILQLSDRFDGYYDIELKTTSDSGIVLSSYGELFFRGVITGLQSLCPNLFFIQVLVPEKMAVVPYDLSLQTTYTERIVGSDLEKGFDRLGDVMGVSGAFTAGMIFLVGMLALCIWVKRKGWPVELGLTGSVVIGLAAMFILGGVMFTVMILAALVGGGVIVYLTLLKRS